MNTPESQAILREVQRRKVRNAELKWEDITANKSFFLVASLMFYRVGEMELDKLCKDYFDIDTVPDGDAIDYNLSIAEKVLSCTLPSSYQELKKRAEKVKKENTCECCEGWGNGIGLATGDNGVEMWVCRFCDVDGSNYNGWGEHHCSECGMEDGDCDCDDAEPIQCTACGDPDCVEPEDPMDARFCESCNEESKRINEKLDKHNEEMDTRHNPPVVLSEEEFDKKYPNTDIDFLLKGLKMPSATDLKIIIKKKEEPAPDTPALIERMRIQVQNEYGKMTNKQLYEWIILNKKPNQKIRKNQKKEELLNLIVLIKTKIV